MAVCITAVSSLLYIVTPLRGFWYLFVGGACPWPHSLLVLETCAHSLTIACSVGVCALCSPHVLALPAHARVRHSPTYAAAFS